jgi:methylenetetrahydrofolate reductase (NADPH)
MRIIEAFGRDEPVFSFEFSPPRTDEAAEQLRATVREFAALRPDYVSVTYGAGGSTRERTIETVTEIKRDTGIEAMAHLTCVGHTKDEIRELLDAYAAGGVQNILALGGDPPSDAPMTGDFRYAIELVELVRDHPGGFSVGVAAHPEKHPRSPSLDTDRRIDFVFVTNRVQDGRGTVREAMVVLDERDGDQCASDHFGVLAEVQITPDR